MFCPQCGAEYRAGFNRCSDCNVKLVEALPSPDNSVERKLRDESFGMIKRVWSGKDEERCLTLCERLRANAIPFKVDQRRRQYLLRVEEHYTIGVPVRFFEDARKLIIKGHLAATDQPRDQ